MTASPNDTFVSPLAQRNASQAMLEIWSPRHKFTTWRKIWLAVAESQSQMHLPVTPKQVEDIRAVLNVTDDDIKRAGEHEARLRHDVMAHVHALGDVAPQALPILHLGMTSEDVGSNADLLIMHEALDLTILKIARVIDALAEFASRWKSLPTLGYTHFQAAQPTTVGRRAAQWAYDLWLCLDRVNFTRTFLRLRGLKGATGTQASFQALFKGDTYKVDKLEEKFVAHFKRALTKDEVHVLTPQTYPRVQDAFVVSDLAATGAVIHKICNDVRLLCGKKELDEPFGESQVGSSAMPYKQNPMRCERATGLCRFVMSLAQNPLDTAATQWLERTLDDSSNRRVVIPEAFLALDGALDLLHNVTSGLFVHEASIRANLVAEMPFIAVENMMVAAVKAGRDRQAVHEAIRRHAREAARRVKEQGLNNDLVERLKNEPLLAGIDVDKVMDPMSYVGRSIEQVERFLTDIAGPVQERYASRLAEMPSSEPGV